MAFGRWYPLDAPWYLFPGVILVKLPLGLTLLALAGAVLLVRRWRETPGRLPLAAAAGLAAVFLVLLGSGQAYAGVRHALPVFPALALLAGVALAAAVRGGTALRVAAAAGLIGAAASALPVLRPWEYYNELIGGPANGYLYFADEGVDLGQRTRELTRYYERELRPRGVVPVLGYPISPEERLRSGIRSVGMGQDSAERTTNRISGTVLLRATDLAPFPRFDLGEMRKARPVARFGNLLVLRGTFRIPWRRSMAFYVEGLKALSYENDPRKAESLFAQAVRLYPAHYPAAVEWGNLLARRGAREEAIRAFEQARVQALPGDPLRERLAEQVRRLRREPPQSLPPVRDPWAE
jgi:tetratricopeptide (TPR) repeat protein